MEYVDNVCLTSHTFLHMQRKLDDLWEVSKKVGLVINSMKREEIRVNKTLNEDLTLTLSHPTEYIYSTASHISCPDSTITPLIFISEYWKYWLQVCAIRDPYACSCSDYSCYAKACRVEREYARLSRGDLRNTLFDICLNACVCFYKSLLAAFIHSKYHCLSKQHGGLNINEF
jgi:hypothetical protein